MTHRQLRPRSLHHTHRRRLVTFALALLVVMLAPGRGHAHPFAPTVLEIDERGDGVVELALSTAVAAAAARDEAGPGWPRMPAGCVEREGATGAREPAAGFASRLQQRVASRRAVYDCADLVAGDGELQIVAPDDRVLLVQHRTLDGELDTRVIRGTATLRLGGSSPERPRLVAPGYFALGVEHILTGVDHLLFVLCLLLLTKGMRRRLLAISAFTVAHSVTLGLAVLGWVRLPGPPVEAAIALSIGLLAGEVALGRAPRSRVALAAVVFVFGLVHGLGFAGALADLGLPQTGVVGALLAFNVGMEVGQLAFVAVVVGLFALLSRMAGRLDASHLARARVVVAYAIGTVAALLFVDRVVSFWGA